MARETPSWGYTRLRGAVMNVGLDLGRSTIARILKDNGIEPAPLRGKTLSWKTLLKAHWDAVAAADFFSFAVVTVGGLVRYLVLFVSELKTRRIHIAGITSRANGAWVAQIARDLIDSVAGPLIGAVCLIVDRAPVYTEHFETLLSSAGVTLLRLPARSPNLNAFAERFVRSIKHECLRYIVPPGQRVCGERSGKSSGTITPNRITKASAMSFPFQRPILPTSMNEAPRESEIQFTDHAEVRIAALGPTPTRSGL